MFRIIMMVVALACALQCAAVQAQRHGHSSPHRHSPPAQPSIFGFGFGSIGNAHRANPNFGQPGSTPHYGYDYIYDPYRSGRFVAPDLILNDPFFRTQHLRGRKSF